MSGSCPGPAREGRADCHRAQCLAVLFGQPSKSYIDYLGEGGSKPLIWGTRPPPPQACA